MIAIIRRHLAVLCSAAAAACLLDGAALPKGDLQLDRDEPVVEAVIAGVPLKLHVDLDQRETLLLDPAAAARLPLIFHDAGVDNVGRVRLPVREADATVTVDGRTVRIKLTTNGRPCCAKADGAISAAVLPWRRISFVRMSDTAIGPPRTLQMRWSEADGLILPNHDNHGVDVQFSLEAPQSVATGAAGARLAVRWHGAPTGPYGRTAAAFGIVRSSRFVRFAPPAEVAGFRFAMLPVLLADWSGKERLPSPAAEVGDIVVAAHVRQQQAWPLVLIGADQLDACPRIDLDTIMRQLSLTCAPSD